MVMPFETGFVIESPYGYRRDPITGEAHVWHGGVDLCGNDRKVRSVVPGYVLRSRIVTDPDDKTSEWGEYVSVMGDDGKVIYYCHLATRNVQNGQRVSAGAILGIEGTTGRSTGLHLHFEVRDAAGNQMDPCAYLEIPNIAGYEWDPPEPWEQETHEWSRDAVEWCIQRGILHGKGGGNYALGDSLTREEMCVMLYRAREVL